MGAHLLLFFLVIKQRKDQKTTTKRAVHRQRRPELGLKVSTLCVPRLEKMSEPGATNYMRPVMVPERGIEPRAY